MREDVFVVEGDVHDNAAAADGSRVWVRTCPICGRVLSKWPGAGPLRCACGWEWQG